MKNYFESLSNLIAELKSYSHIEVQKFTVKSGYPIEYIEETASSLRLELAPEVSSFYQQLSEVEIVWNLKSVDGNSAFSAYGEIFTQDIYKCLAGRTLSDYWLRRIDEQTRKKQPEWLAKFNPFDYFNSDPTQIAGLILQEGTFVSDRLAVYQESIGFGELNINLEEYLDYAIKAKVMNGWQNALWLDKYNLFLKNVRDLFNNKSQ